MSTPMPDTVSEILSRPTASVAVYTDPAGYYLPSEECDDCRREYAQIVEDHCAKHGAAAPIALSFLDWRVEEYVVGDPGDTSCGVVRLCRPHAEALDLIDDVTCAQCVAEDVEPARRGFAEFCARHHGFDAPDAASLVDDEERDCHYCTSDRESGQQGTGDTDLRLYLDGGVVERLCRTHALAAFGDEDCADTAHRAAAICQS